MLCIFYLDGWNGKNSYQLDRIMRGAGYIENHCLSLLGGIQPDRLLSYLDESIKGHGNDGLLQRFQLLTYPDMPQWQYVDEAPNTTARDVVYGLFEKIDKRFRPFSSLAMRTIGFVNENNKGAGLEYTFNNQLAGRNGQALFRKMSGGTWKPMHDESEVRPVDGVDIQTTINTYAHLNDQDLKTAFQKFKKDQS